MSHSHHDIFESRKQFQLERIILFSDAVFAIAITLLILEIKMPEAEHGTQAETIRGLVHLIPDFIGYLISFAVIGQFWTNHHKLFGYVSGYDGGLLWLNLLMLFFVAIMPFTTHLNMQRGNLDIVWFLYCLNLALIGLSIYFIWRYIGKKEGLSYIYYDRKFFRYARARSLAVTFVFLAGGLLTFVPFEWVKWTSRFVFVFIFPALNYVRKRYYGKVVRPVPAPLQQPAEH